MQPINYMQGYQNPLETVLNQARMFQDFSQNANVLAGQREQNRLAMAHNDRRIQAMKELQGIDFKNIDALREFHGRYGDLEYGKGLNDYLANLSEQERKAEIGQLSQVYSALKNERYDTAKNFLLEQAQAYENAGNKDKADKARQMAQLVESDPKTAFQNVAMGYSLVVPKDTMDNFDKLIKSQAPNTQYHNMGDRMVATMVDPMTGQMKTHDVGEIGVSADTKANNERALDVAHIQGGYNLQERQMQEAGANAREQAKLELQSKLAQQEALIKANEVKPMEYGGKMWLVRADGKFKPMVGADGQQLSAGGVGGTGGGKPLTDTQSNAYTFGTRMLQSNDIVSRLEQQGVKMNWGQLQLDKDSLITTRTLVNAFSSPQQQQYAQAVDDFIHAVLRKESGAAIGADEYKGALRQYFPMPSDSPQVISQKAQNRKTTLAGILGGVPNDFLLSQGIDLNAIKGDETNKPKSYQDMALPR